VRELKAKVKALEERLDIAEITNNVLEQELREAPNLAPDAPPACVHDTLRRELSLWARSDWLALAVLICREAGPQPDADR
jgi:hypothetical protein